MTDTLKAIAVAHQKACRQKPKAKGQRYDVRVDVTYHKTITIFAADPAAALERAEKLSGRWFNGDKIEVISATEAA